MIAPRPNSHSAPALHRIYVRLKDGDSCVAESFARDLESAI